MPEIGTSGSMSGDGKRSVGHRPQATAPILDSTDPADLGDPASRRLSGGTPVVMPTESQRQPLPSGPGEFHPEQFLT